MLACFNIARMIDTHKSIQPRDNGVAPFKVAVATFGFGCGNREDEGGSLPVSWLRWSGLFGGFFVRIHPLPDLGGSPFGETKEQRRNNFAE